MQTITTFTDQRNFDEYCDLIAGASSIYFSLDGSYHPIDWSKEFVEVITRERSIILERKFKTKTK